jgi:hypothetical protein
MWSKFPGVSVPDQNNVFQNNTIQLPLLANGIGIYGGTGNSCLSNRIRDTIVNGAGIQIANRFTVYPLSGTTLIQGNQLDRTGSFSTDFGINVGALWLFAYENNITGLINVTNNTLNDSTYQGVLLSGLNALSSITGTTLDTLNVTTSGSCGIQILTKGSGYFHINIRPLPPQHQLVAIIVQFVLGLSFCNQFRQRGLLKHVHTQNL